MISPLLANIYMRRFIQAFKLFKAPEKFGAKLVNYADDFVILCTRQPAELLDHVGAILGKLGLELNPRKTGIKDAWVEPFTFLGYTIGPWYHRGTGRRCLGSVPVEKALSRFRENVRRTLRKHVTAPLDDAVKALNRRIVGWGNYFSFGQVQAARIAMDRFVLTRVRGFLRRRHKLESRGVRQFSHEYVREQLGVLSLNAMRLWKPAHAKT